MLTGLVDAAGEVDRTERSAVGEVQLGDAKVTVEGRVGMAEVEAYMRALNEGAKPHGTAEDGD
ncbi:hypothetical protein [Nocardiopsis sp. SBT366]|uniref:hypothetical protein n=1 Tax=Nocardiopsis sp. SBT366 TaxID=1580529 RepID=UPI0012E1BB69|nr:hypothetical protein [Nocardiopsis sp. SBT366]